MDQKLNNYSKLFLCKAGNLKRKGELTKSIKVKKTKLASELENAQENYADHDELQSANDIKAEWEDYELLSQENCIDEEISRNIIKLFGQGNTIPFIARYRKHVTDNMSPESLRLVKESYERICNLKSKMKLVVQNIEKTGKLNNILRKSILSIRTLEELEHIYAPYKTENKKTLSERAKALGLENVALNILNASSAENLNNYVQSQKKGLEKLENVEKGVIHIIASIIATDTDLLAILRNLRSDSYFGIEVKKAIKKKTDNKKLDKKADDENKFQNYFDFKTNSKYIKPYQMLAINRGENLKILSIKINVPDYVFKQYLKFCENKWVKRENSHSNRYRIMNEAIKDSYTRLVQPLILREIRRTLNESAEKASRETFSKNLKQLLLGSPLKGKLILGIDPGFSYGCKIALISETGSVLTHNVIFPHKGKPGAEEAKYILKDILVQHKCNLIALGNGTACRETENFLTELISSKAFAPLEVVYTIVSEDGASIYSCSSEAKKEFPDLDPNIIGAISLARRVQEPLAELVKVEPQHLGVGMYQHDLKKKELQEALDEVVSECVSFVGVDLNTASQCLLRRIAGLSDKRASQIIEYRESNGPFTYRKELTKVKGIGPKVFEQCAGFLRVGPVTEQEQKTFYKRTNTTKLDCTYVHPESYSCANKLMKILDLKQEDIGTTSFIGTVKNKKNSLDVEKLVDELNTDKESLNIIFDALSKPLNYDLRSDCSISPMFKKGLTSINDLKIGTILSGRVTNVTDFGSFVDIGVGTNGLIHSSQLKGCQLQIGDKLEVEVLNIELDRKRIGLKPKN